MPALPRPGQGRERLGGRAGRGRPAGGGGGAVDGGGGSGCNGSPAARARPPRRRLLSSWQPFTYFEHFKAGKPSGAGSSRGLGWLPGL